MERYRSGHNGAASKAVGSEKGHVGSNPTLSAMLSFLKRKKKEPKNLKEILAQFEILEKNFKKLSQELEKLKKESQFFISKVGIVRYNPFSQIGGNQSFSIAFLDGKNNGFVITSLYTREGNRVYAKPVQNGKSQYFLSKEEKEAIAKAMKTEIS